MKSSSTDRQQQAREAARLRAQAPLVNANHTEAQYFVAAMEQLGVSQSDATQMLVDAGGQASKLVGSVANASEPAREDLLRALRVPYPGTEAVSRRSAGERTTARSARRHAENLSR